MFLKKFKRLRRKTAVFAFGRLNPPTVGHLRLVNQIKSIDGDHYLFLSHTCNPNTDPLDFETKLKYARKFFEINVGHHQVRTIIQALQYLHELGYENIVYVAGSDRLDTFKTLIEKYNGNLYNFKNISVVSAGGRDPDDEGVAGISATRLRVSAAENDFETFINGVPNRRHARKLFLEVKRNLKTKQEASIDG